MLTSLIRSRQWPPPPTLWIVQGSSTRGGEERALHLEAGLFEALWTRVGGTGSEQCTSYLSMCSGLGYFQHKALPKTTERKPGDSTGLVKGTRDQAHPMYRYQHPRLPARAMVTSPPLGGYSCAMRCPTSHCCRRCCCCCSAGQTSPPRQPFLACPLDRSSCPRAPPPLWAPHCCSCSVHCQVPGLNHCIRVDPSQRRGFMAAHCRRSPGMQMLMLIQPSL